MAIASYILVVYHGHLPWSFIMAVYHGRLPWSITMAVYHGSSPWHMLTRLYYRNSIKNRHVVPCWEGFSNVSSPPISLYLSLVQLYINPFPPTNPKIKWNVHTWYKVCLQYGRPGVNPRIQSPAQLGYAWILERGWKVADHRNVGQWIGCPYKPVKGGQALLVGSFQFNAHAGM